MQICSPNGQVFQFSPVSLDGVFANVCISHWTWLFHISNYRISSALYLLAHKQVTFIYFFPLLYPRNYVSSKPYTLGNTQEPR